MPSKKDSSKKELEKFRKLLLAQREEILKNIRETKEQMANPQPEEFLDESDIASTEVSQRVVLRLRDRERKLLDKIEKALRKIDEGTYGICEACGAPISPKRLESRPVATLCIKCKEEQEREELDYYE